jgi:hypothetical protein
MIVTGRYVLEEQIFAALSARYPEVFDRWYGDYWGMLENYTGIRRDVGCVLDDLEHCRSVPAHEAGTKIVRALLDAMDRRLVRLRADETARFLFEGLICAYYTDRELAEKLADVTVSLLRYAPEAMEAMFSRYGDQVRQNLAFLDRRLGEPRVTWEELVSSPGFHMWLSCL